jgi:hypothetical protein
MILEFEGYHINIEHIVMVTAVSHSTFESALYFKHLYFELHCIGKTTVFEVWIQRSDDYEKEVEHFLERREKLLRLWKQELQRQEKTHLS